VAWHMRNEIDKCEGWHRICETGLVNVKPGMAYAKRDWEMRKEASDMRNGIGKCEARHGICETGLINAKGGMAYAKWDW
jgi:hypothetical protein